MLEAVFITGVDEITVTGLTQWDRGQMIQITCPNLPSAFQVHFANRKSKKAVVVQATGANNVATVVIPDALLQQPFELFAYLYFDENLIGETTKTVRMPVERRKKPDDYVSELTPQQATDAEKIVMKLMDEYVAKEVAAVTSAAESAAQAKTAADEAKAAAAGVRDVTEDVAAAEAAASAAETAKQAAQAAQAAAEQARNEAQAVAGGDFLPLAGGTLTGALTLAGDPTADLHASTKRYVDTTINNAIGEALEGSY